ncbi:MAG TPA: PrsW family intramembrane metalloprotease [Intrasporangiaceae bacterium]|nr:PrsW family intramembrane metalloprotease [Intrasporangiaceae bacterium]
MSSAPSAPTATAAPATNPTTRPRLRATILLGLTIVGFSICALALAAYFQASLGVMVSLLAVLFAALPLLVVIPTFLWLDRFEAEPTRLLVFAFLWGALVSAFVAAVLNTGAVLGLQAGTDPESALAVGAVVVAPVVEEALKGFLILLIWWLHRREFDGITDGMVYAGVCAAGFAFTENIQYLGQAFTEGGGAVLAGTFVVRGIMSPFAHPMFTVLIGIGVGLAASTHKTWVKVVAPFVGYVLAVLGHGLWNLAAVAGGTGLLVGYFLVGVPVFFGFVALILWARNREGRLIARHLSPYADAGWLSRGEVGMLASMPRRREARMWARMNAGPSGLAAMRAFQDTASELALLRKRMHHSTASAQCLEEERHLLGALVAQRRAFLGERVG